LAEYVPTAEDDEDYDDHNYDDYDLADDIKDLQNEAKISGHESLDQEWVLINNIDEKY